MLRVLQLAAIICVCCVMFPSVAAKTLSVNGHPQTQTGSSDAIASLSNTPSTTANSHADEVSDSENKQHEKYYHPAEDRKPRVIEEFNHQSLDGSYEYKYTLSNGVTRYEKSYWKPVGKGKRLLARKGFYSHPLTNHKYLTVFYTADEHGYQQDTAKFTNAVPTLPKYLDVPQLEIPQETGTIITTPRTTKPAAATTTTATTQKPTTTRKTTTRKPKVAATQQPLAKPSKFNWIY